MQLEFSYQLADLREVQIPEAYDANPAKYRRRWIRLVVSWAFSVSMIALYLWLQRMLPQPTVPARATPQFEPRIELLPAIIPAFYIFIVYLLTIAKTWRTSRDPSAATAAPRDIVGRVIRTLSGGIIGAAIWFGIAGTWDWGWYPSRTQIALVTVAPWIVLIGFMQVLGVLQRRGKSFGPWRTNAAWQRPKSVTMDGSGLRLRDALYYFEFEWPYFKRVRETRNLLVLIGEGGMQYLIPKRAFADPADIEHCRSLLQNRVPHTRFLVRPMGFAVLPKPAIPLPELPGDSSPSPSLTLPREPGTMQPANELEPQP
jgi:hypothetical protein